MSDIICRRCGEPWDSYGVLHHEDMDRIEARRLLRGIDCPHCHKIENMRENKAYNPLWIDSVIEALEG